MNIENNKAILYGYSALIPHDQIPSKFQAAEKTCQSLAETQGMTIVETFFDIGVSGDTADRPEFNRMIAYLKSLPSGHGTTVLIADIALLARNTTVILKLKQAIEDAGATLICANYPDLREPEAEFAMTLNAIREEWADRREKSPD